MGLTGSPVTGRVIPNSDGAGIIDEVGPGVPPSRMGERVWTWNAQWVRPFGTSAEYCVLPQHLVAPLHDVDFAAGDCLGIPALTAHQAVFSGGDVRDLTLLVAGGAGAVGHYAVQLAKWAGARVLATVSSAEKALLAGEAGADAIIDYRRENVVSRVMELTDQAGVDRIVEVDFAANVDVDVRILKVNGVIAAYSSSVREVKIPFQAMMVRGIEVDGVYVYLMKSAERRRALADMDALLSGDRLMHNVAARFPLSDIVAAHDLQESGKAMGNIVLDVNNV
jgi:NADPH2:quinone reductase